MTKRLAENICNEINLYIHTYVKANIAQAILIILLYNLSRLEFIQNKKLKNIAFQKIVGKKKLLKLIFFFIFCVISFTLVKKLSSMT